jgi:hypothetical protein
MRTRNYSLTPCRHQRYGVNVGKIILFLWLELTWKSLVERKVWFALPQIEKPWMD